MTERTMTENTGKMRDWIIALTEHDFSWKRVQGLDILDDIEREVADRYMELPLDADGVPIRVGDEMEFGENHNQGIVKALNEHMVIAMHVDDGCMNYAKYGLLWNADTCRHIKHRTVEDVLTDLAEDVERGCPPLNAVAKYIGQLRELLGVDE